MHVKLFVLSLVYSLGGKFCLIILYYPQPTISGSRRPSLASVHRWITKVFDFVQSFHKFFFNNFQHNFVNSKLFESSIWTGIAREGTQTGDEEAAVSPSRTTTAAKIPTDDNYRRLDDSLHRLQADSNAFNIAAHSNTKLDRRVVAISRGEWWIFSAIWPEESAMMTNVQLVNATTQLKLAATLFFLNPPNKNKTFLRSLKDLSSKNKPNKIVKCLIVF